MANSQPDPNARKVLDIVGNLPDPEIPVLTLDDLGVIRNVDVNDQQVTVDVAPTYSGCPATEFIQASIVEALEENGYHNVATRTVLTPPWTTDWISETGRKKLRAYGIVPPDTAFESKRSLLRQDATLACPRCGSVTTQIVSEFGSTPCKASYKCSDCLEPFEYFKCL